MTLPAPVGPDVDAGWQALQAGDWHAARARFTTAAAANDSPEAYEGLGWACYFLDEDPGTFDARERAYQRYRAQGDDASAARVAAWLAADHIEFRGEPAVANGWIQRAHRLLDGREPGADHGWLAVHEASFRILDDPTSAARLGAEAAALGRRFGVPELEMVGLATEGEALVVLGELEVGMRRLDEASVLALSGEATLVACVAWACCYLISACEQVRDYHRAGQWCVRMTDFCQDVGIGVLLGQCRAKYASVLTWLGRWDEAERQLTWAQDELAAARPALVGEAVVRLAGLRHQQGRIDDAERLYSRSATHLHAQVGRAALALERDRPQEALDLLDRFLRRVPVRDPERSTGLELAVESATRLGRDADADRALHELRALADRVGTDPLRASVSVAQATRSTATGDLEAARRHLEDAVDLFASQGAMFEEVRARAALARTLHDLGRVDAAIAEMEAVLERSRTLGAAGVTDRAETSLAAWRSTSSSPDGASIDAPGRSTSPAPTTDANGPLAVLSPREREVLGLVADGLTNPQIAHRLVLSEHTVHRHVGNILRKLALPSRTAAASLAVQHGLR